MSIRSVPTPTSRCRVGIGRVDITPPVGIYHRFWGAAKHDRATGVHRPLTASVVVFQSLHTTADDDVHVLVAVDHCLLRPPEMEFLLTTLSAAISLHRSRITVTFSHTHSAAHVSLARENLPGGELIRPYLESLPGKITAAYFEARSAMGPATMTYATGRCTMGRHRDYWDEQSNQWVCGYNPGHDDSIGLPLNVVRITDEQGETVGTIVNYPCHPTTLAWDNSLISPDYIGALRETVEQHTGAPCVFLLAPCGEIGPRFGFVGDTEVADRNGRQVGHAALSILEETTNVGHDFHYCGPVVSGATIGKWEFRPHDPIRNHETTIFRRRNWTVSIPYLRGLPTVPETESQMAAHLAEEESARQRGDAAQAADFRALAERDRRLLERIRPLPPGKKYAFPLDVLQLGDAFWVFVEGEPYHELQHRIATAFPNASIVFVTLANGTLPSYLPTREAYAKPALYQANIAILEPGCLEQIGDEIEQQIAIWSGERGA